MRAELDMAELDPRTVSDVLTALARHDARWLRAHPGAPLLGESGVVYRRERNGERWSDVAQALRYGHDDCDGLAAWRAGELLARGRAALARGEPGWEARGLAGDSIPAVVGLIRMRGTRTYHAVVRFELGGKTYQDDPSARLGMWGGEVSPDVLARWAALGVSPRHTPEAM